MCNHVCVCINRCNTQFTLYKVAIHELVCQNVRKLPNKPPKVVAHNGPIEVPVQEYRISNFNISVSIIAHLWRVAVQNACSCHPVWAMGGPFKNVCVGNPTIHFRPTCHHVSESLLIAVCKDSYVVYACGFARVGKLE